MKLYHFGLLILAICLAVFPDQTKAASVYYAAADGCVARSSTGADAVFAVSLATECNPATNNGPFAAYAKSSSGGLGVDVNGTHICCQTGNAPSAIASVRTDFSILGPTADVLVSANLSITYGLGGGTSNDLNYRFIEARVNLGSGPDYFSSVTQTAGPNGESTTSSGFGFQLGANALCLPGACNIVTPTVLLQTGRTYSFYMQLYATVIFGVGTSVGKVAARDTLYFPTTGPVFNLPDGYQINMPGLNVVDNRVVGPTAEGVPEPATALAIATGILGIIALRRRGTKA